MKLTLTCAVLLVAMAASGQEPPVRMVQNDLRTMTEGLFKTTDELEQRLAALEKRVAELEKRKCEAWTIVDTYCWQDGSGYTHCWKPKEPQP
jgi:hypothetical protein